MNKHISSYDELPEKAVIECSQLTKENSIEGCKKKGVTIIYTWASNLLKTADMETGAVSFKDQSKVVKMHIEKDNIILKRISKTKVEKHPNLEREQTDYLKVFKRE